MEPQNTAPQPQQIEPAAAQPEATPTQNPGRSKKLLWIVLAVVVVLAAAWGVKSLLDSNTPHRKKSAAQTNTYLPSGVSANTAGSKGAWLKLGQGWQVPLDDGQVNYQATSDGTRVFLSVQSFSSAKSELRAYDGATGKLDWAVVYTGKNAPYGYPTAGNGVVTTATTNNQVVGYDAATGKELWRKAAGPFYDRLESYGAFLDGTFYYTQNHAGDSHADIITGIDPKTGAEKFTHTASAPFGYQSVRVSGDHLVLGTDEGTVGAFSKDLQLLWQKKIDGLNADKTYAFGNVVIAAKPAGADQNQTELWALKSTTGKLLWHKTVAGQYAIAPVAVGDTLILDGPVPDWKLYGYSLSTGGALWTSPAKPDGSYGRDKLTVADGTLFAAGHSLEIINPKDGTVTYSKLFKYGAAAAPVAAGDHIVGVYANGIYGLN